MEKTQLEDFRRVLNRCTSMTDELKALVTDNRELIKGVMAEVDSLSTLSDDVAKSTQKAWESSLPKMSESMKETLFSSLHKDLDDLAFRVLEIRRNAKDLKIWDQRDVWKRRGWTFLVSFVGGLSAVYCFSFILKRGWF